MKNPLKGLRVSKTVPRSGVTELLVLRPKGDLLLRKTRGPKNHAIEHHGGPHALSKKGRIGPVELRRTTASRVDPAALPNRTPDSLYTDTTTLLLPARLALRLIHTYRRAGTQPWRESEHQTHALLIHYAGLPRTRSKFLDPGAWRDLDLNDQPAIWQQVLKKITGGEEPPGRIERSGSGEIQTFVDEQGNRARLHLESPFGPVTRVDFSADVTGAFDLFGFRIEPMYGAD